MEIKARICAGPEVGMRFKSFLSENEALAFLDSPDFTVFPGFCDVHVHFREPGFSYKETIATGTAAAARGGVTTVCTMPNLDPVPDTPAHLAEELELIRREAVIGVVPYGALTMGEKGAEPADLAGMAPDVAGFSDDGHGVQSEEMMRSLMLEAKRLGKTVAAHCEQNDLLHGGYVHASRYAREHGHAGICSESEWRPIERDIRLAEETGCAYHICHISAKESVALIRAAKARGVNVTCETAPHYLMMNGDQIEEDGRFKMNPPLRDEEDRLALTEGVRDGTIDMIATDHAPHSAEEKSRGLKGSAFGVVGLETSFAAAYTTLVCKGVISLERLIAIMSGIPRARFGLPQDDSFSVWRLGERFTVDPAGFLSKGRATPLAGMTLNGVNYLTVSNGRIVYRKQNEHH